MPQAVRNCCLALCLSLLAVAPATSATVAVQRPTWPETMVATREVVPTSADKRGEFYAAVYRDLWESWPQLEWFLQDGPYRAKTIDRFDPWAAVGWYFEDHSPVLEAAMIRTVLGELSDGDEAYRVRLEALERQGAPVTDARWLTLYEDACQQRRRQRLASLARVAPRVVFTKHYTLGGSHYAYTEGQSDAQAERHFVPGSALCLLEWDGEAYVETTLLSDPTGIIRDPDVSYDGRRVLFAWKKSLNDDDYHLYEMTVATRKVRQLTSGLGVADYEGVYLPDGDLLFNSTRCVQTVDCWWTEVSNLYRCSPDGTLIRRLTFDQVHDNYPTVTDEGTVLYTRWEYNDRGQIYPQPLLQMYPDGTGQTESYGGNSWFPTAILHARAVPESSQIAAIASGHHSRQTGKLIVLDPARGRQENQGAQLIAPVRETRAVKVDGYGQNGELFQYPYPLSATEFLITYHPVGWPWKDRLGVRTGIYYLTREGARERLALDTRLPCSQPVPLRPRQRPPVRRSPVNLNMDAGTCYIQNVYRGLAMDGVRPGTVRTVRVVALKYRAAGIGSNGNRGPGGGALVSTPVAVGNGTWDPKVILGEAPVHEDGSAFFTVPARTPFYLQLLDARKRLVQTMRSWTTVQPGESAACAGCHEDKNSTLTTEAPPSLALREGPETLRAAGDPRGFSFSREVQPLLDRHCVKCHSDSSKAAPAASSDRRQAPAASLRSGTETGATPAAFSLLGREVLDRAAKRRWTESYLALTHAHPDDAEHNARWRGAPDHPVLNWVSAQSPPPIQPPRSAGSGTSQLLDLLEGGHGGVKLAPQELQTLAAWIDLGVPFCGDYREAHAWSPQEVEKYNRYAAKRAWLEEEEREGLESRLRNIEAATPGVSVP